MRKQKNRCGKIKDLEKRLACLKEKYEQLTNQLETQRGNSATDEEILDYHNIIEERRLVEKYMQKLTSYLKEEERSTSGTTRSGIIGPGTIVLLVNNNHKLKLRVVERIYNNNEEQISIDSPIGKAVLGKRVGDTIIVETPKGKIHYKIVSIK